MRPIRVTIVGTPVACGGEVKDTWRQLSRCIAGQLQVRYGDAVQLEYRDLLDPDCPRIPDGAHLPLVLVNEAVLSSGGKLSAPRIRQAVEALGASPVLPEGDGVAASAHQRAKLSAIQRDPAGSADRGGSASTVTVIGG